MEIFKIEPEMVKSLDNMNEEELLAFIAELQDTPFSDSQMELYIYTRFLAFTRIGPKEHLESALQMTQFWVTATPDNHADRKRRIEILGKVVATGLEHGSTVGDELQLEIGKVRLVATPAVLLSVQDNSVFEEPCHPERRCTGTSLINDLLLQFLSIQ
jgi:hypothetical protein